MKEVILREIENKIYIIRGQKVMLDSDLAELYGVKTKRINEQVRRNLERFPEDFMFRLTKDEFDNLRSQFATSSVNYGGRRYQPLVFTENGVAMLSTVLKSKQAIQINTAIMRIFTRLRSFFMLEKELTGRMDKFESDATQVFKIVFERLDNLEGKLPSHPEDRKRIGIKPTK